MKSIRALPQIAVDYDLETSKLVYERLETFKDENGALCCTSESGQLICDYYEDWINPTLTKWAEAQGYFWEWVHPSCLVLVEA